MAASDDVTPLRCSICFNNKESRQPRILLCQHSFCQDCLQTWHEKSPWKSAHNKPQVECPMCRTKTSLPAGGIKALPTDIHVQQFAEFLQKGAGVASCKLCKVEKATFSCKTCSAILCLKCSVKHTQVSLFSAHEIIRGICELHGTAVQYECMTCASGVCMDCIHTEIHKDHTMSDVGSRMTDLKKLITKRKREISDKHEEFKDLQNKAEDNIGKALQQMKAEIERLEMEVKHHHKSHKEMVHTIFKGYENEIDENRCTVIGGASGSGTGSNSLSFTLPDSGVLSDQCCQIDGIDRAIECLKDCKLVCGIPKALGQSLETSTIVLVKKIDALRGFDMSKIWRLCGTQHGDVIVCGRSGDKVYKVCKNGTKILLSSPGQAACVYDNEVYVINADGKKLIQIKQDESTVIHRLNPQVSYPWGLYVIEDLVFILRYDYIVKRRLSDPDDSMIINIPDSGALGHFHVSKEGGAIKLYISDVETNKVIVCNETGKVLTRFGAEGNVDDLLAKPKGITKMSNGHLLVADWAGHRIVEYKTDGTFVRNLLTHTDGLRCPIDVVLRYPYVWVAENDCAPGQGYASLKLFKIAS